MKLNPLTAAAFAGMLMGGAAMGADAPARGAEPGGERPRKGGKGGEVSMDELAGLFRTNVPAHRLDLILARPTKNSMTAKVMAYSDCEGVIQYGTASGALKARTQSFVLKAGQPAEVLIPGLQPDTQVYYSLSTRAGAGAWIAEPEHSFRTQRPPGRSFQFALQADSHLDDKVEPKLLERSMLNCLSDGLDFFIDLGDTFMTDKYRGSRLLAEKHYVAQRYYFGLIGHSQPVFLVLGNHDGEMKDRRRSEEEAVWSNTMRKKYYATPYPDGFYTGNEVKHASLGLLHDYYAWEWGDALFVALDPFWYSGGVKGDNWSSSLGEVQYRWLKRTLETSRAKFKFIFLHHLAGGATPENRGGSEAAAFYEWGGKNLDGTDGFKEHRPGWEMPIHQLLVQNRVSIVFHGHDHIFAKQDLDGVVYQEVPQPGNPEKGGRDNVPRTAAEYGYLAGKILSSPGYMRISVTPDKVVADLVRSYLPEQETQGRKNHSVAFSYEIPAR